jgi:hypothetical protein
MGRTKYSLRDAATPGGFDVASSREEQDLAVAYLLAPGLAASIGYKRLVQAYGPDKYRWQGPTAALSGSARLSGDWWVYGIAGFGVMRAHFPSFDSAKAQTAAGQDAEGRTSFNADYRIGEFGLTYRVAEPVFFTRSLSWTVGYRAQYVNTRGYSLGVTDPTGNFLPNTDARLKDSTQGWVAGLFAVF